MDDIGYLFSLEESFFMKEHPYNIDVVEARRIATRIAAMEDELSALRASLDTVTERMFTRRRRVRRD